MTIASIAPVFELGLNYWPRRRAMDMWCDFALAEIADEFAHIASMGFDTVRVMAMTRDFLTGPASVSATMVDRLVRVARAAADAGLGIVPTLVVINMSGRIWWPHWMLGASGTPADLYADPAVLGAQALLAERCSHALAGGANIRAIDLANEIDDAQRPASRDAGRMWTSVLAAAIRRAAPGIPVQVGAHLPSLTTGNHMRVDDLAMVADEDMMHAYPLYSTSARHFLDPELVPFSCALTSALAARGRRTLMQEFGLCTAPRGSAGISITDDFLGTPRKQYLASEDEGAEYYDAVMSRLVATGAAGAYAWCYADYDAGLWHRQPLDTAVRERTFGLVRADGTEKPAVGVFRELRARRDEGGVAPGDVPHVLDVSADEYYASPGVHFDRLYARWLEARA